VGARIRQAFVILWPEKKIIMRISTIVLAATALAIGLYSCQSDKKADKQAAAPATEMSSDTTTGSPAVSEQRNFPSQLERTSWEVIKLDFEGMSFRPDSARIPQIDFLGAKLNALGVCNRFSATYDTPDNEGAMTIAAAATTDNTGCPVASFKFDRRMFDILEHATTYRMTQGGLVLISDKGQIICRER
jgi:heat shock protein HslJ